MLCARRRRAAPRCSAARASAPAGATIAHYRGARASTSSPAPACWPPCVPGAFDAWMLLLRDYGTMAPARRAGAAPSATPRDGYPLVGAHRRDHRDGRASCSATRLADLGRASTCRGGEVPRAGRAVPQPGARRHLRAAAARGRGRRRRPRGADRGGARAPGSAGLRRRGDRPLLPHARGAGRLAAGGTRGVLTADDMAALARDATRRRSTYDYGGYTVLKAGPWSQGPVLLQQLALLEGFDLDAHGPGRRRVRAPGGRGAKLAFADREAWYGDPTSTCRWTTLLSRAYNAERRKLIGEPRPRWSCGRARPTARRAGRSPSALGGAAGAADVGADRRPASRPVGARSASIARRHLPPRRRRPLGQHGLGHAVAAAGCSPRRSIPELGFCLGTRGADVLAGGGPADAPRARQAAAHHAVAVASRCATASRGWRSARRAATSRTSGASASSCAHVHHGLNLQEAIDAPACAHRALPVARSGRARRCPRASRSRRASRRRRSASCAARP